MQASGYASRWNEQGIFMLYTAESMALACLENLVHRNGMGLHTNFEVMHIELPKGIQVEVLDPKKLPIGWNDITEKGKMICRKLGSDWAKSHSTCILKVPSVIIPNEFNYLINCNHPDFKKIKIVKHHPFLFDERL